jgi:hypothetical protein
MKIRGHTPTSKKEEANGRLVFICGDMAELASGEFQKTACKNKVMCCRRGQIRGNSRKSSRSKREESNYTKCFEDIFDVQ